MSKFLNASQREAHKIKANDKELTDLFTFSKAEEKMVTKKVDGKPVLDAEGKEIKVAKVLMEGTSEGVDVGYWVKPDTFAKWNKKIALVQGQTYKLHFLKEVVGDKEYTNLVGISNQLTEQQRLIMVTGASITISAPAPVLE